MVWVNWMDGTLALKAGVRAFDESKVARQPKGAPNGKGGEFAPQADAGAVGVIADDHLMFNPKRVVTELGEQPLRARMFRWAKRVLVLFQPKEGKFLFGVSALRNSAGEVYEMHADVLRAALARNGMGRDKADDVSVDEMDKWVRGTFHYDEGKKEWGLELNTSYAAGTRFDRVLQRWDVHDADSLVNIGEMLAGLRAKGFPSEMKVQIWRGIPGRRGSDSMETTLAEKWLGVV